MSMKKILIIDDDEDIAAIVEHILIKHGFNVRTHLSGNNVSEVVKFYQPNLILLDIHFFGVLGTHICKELKQLHDMPIILLSADAKKGNAFADCNADDFIQKPFEISHLVNTVSSHLNTCLTIF